MALLGNPDTETKPTAISTPQLWADFSDRLRAFITQRIANEADAEDILQDVFVRIHQHLQSVQDTERITSWLFQITRNAIVDFYRSPTRYREQPAGDALDPLIDKLQQHHDAEMNEADGQL